MSIAAATIPFDFEPISPELVLVASSAERDLARALLPPPRRWATEPAATARSARLSFAAFCATCAAMTLAPLALIVLAH
jgi:hypothetical protein